MKSRNPKAEVVKNQTRPTKVHKHHMTKESNIESQKYKSKSQSTQKATT